MERLHLTLQRTVDESYDVLIGSDLFPLVPQGLNGHARHAIITDHTVRRLYAHALLREMKRQGRVADVFAFPPGETSKTLSTCSTLIEQMEQKDYGRDGIVLALGGGVVGDMAGFIAAIYSRGIPVIQIPTTLVAQADASVGGKTGVDGSRTKNLIGSFHQPQRVYMDITTLRTLPQKEIRQGLAEIIKHAVIADSAFFGYLQKHVCDVMDYDTNTLLEVLTTNCGIKAHIVMSDPHEHGKRATLNFGHTIGHAVETLSHYTITHGDAVSIGIMAEARIAGHYGFPTEDVYALESLLRIAGLPTTIPPSISGEGILNVAARDKKSRRAQAHYALPKQIGAMHKFGGTYTTAVDEAVVHDALRATR